MLVNMGEAIQGLCWSIWEIKYERTLLVKMGKVKLLTSQGDPHEPELNPVSVA